MSNPEKITPEEINAAVKFYKDPKNFTGWSLTSKGERISDCIDPRDKDIPRVRPKVTIQTPGGAAGAGHDSALVATLDSGEVVPITTGIEHAKEERPYTVLDAHHDCRFILGFELILREEAGPSTSTLESVERWQNEHRLTFVMHNLGLLSLAARAQLDDRLSQPDPDNIIDLVDNLYPNHHNTAHMEGPNRARVYGVSHHPNVGLDRAKKRKLGVQLYSDSLRAALDDLTNSTRDVRRERRELLVSALILRSAATRTVIGGLHEDMRFLEVKQGRSGLVTVETDISGREIKEG